MEWLYNQYILSWLSIIGTGLTLAGFLATLWGLYLTWKQARAAETQARAAESQARAAESSAKSAQTAAEASRIATERTVSIVKGRLQVADIAIAISNLQTLRSLVQEARYSNLVHVANAFRLNLTTAVRLAVGPRGGRADGLRMVKNLNQVWRLLDHSGTGGLNAEHRDDVLRNLSEIEAFLTMSRQQSLFDITGENSDV